MNGASRKKLMWIFAAAGIAALLVVFAAGAGRALVVDAPERSDVILVLAGETDRRPVRALELLDQGYGRRVVIDVPAAAKTYGFTKMKLAGGFVGALPKAAGVGVAPIDGLSTGD